MANGDMARFFTHEEVATREPPRPEDLRWIAGRLLEFEPFASGSAIVCGSVLWGSNSWRSDIDVAHFSTTEHPRLDRLVNDVLADYAARTNDRHLIPRVDVVTLGAQSASLARRAESTSAQALSAIRSRDLEVVSDLFLDVAVPFSDHVAAIAADRGSQWQAFLENHLAAARDPHPARREITLAYASNMTGEWDKQPLHDLSLGPDGQLTEYQLDLIAKTENYPTNVMRRILGELGEYPSPDRAADIARAFEAIETRWSRALSEVQQQFRDIDQEYQLIVDSVRASQSPLDAAGYTDRVRALFLSLPIPRVLEVVHEYATDAS